MATVLDAFVKFLADTRDIEKSVGPGGSVQKAAEAGAEATATSYKRTLGGALGRGIGLAVSAGLAIATKGALELEQIQADLQAQTGMTAEEAKRAASAINRAAGDNRLSLEEVSDAAVKVHNDLGAVGDEADRLTAKFAKYARVTRQQAGAAVSSFDDILDAWGLTAADADAIMDKLIVSHQKYGGSIEENQAALGKLAPQLIALGATVDDGIALLNLFAASGIDAASAAGALKAAVAKLKPGQDLDDLIQQVSSIEDPTKRAQKAIEIFGARGGTALANALKPGIDSLDDFAVTTEDAAGAVDKAADVLDSTFKGRIQKAISQASAALRQFGADFGPGVTAAASVGSLLASTGLFKGIERSGAKIAGALGKGIIGTLGKLEIGTRLETLLLKGMNVGGRFSFAFQQMVGDAIYKLSSSPTVSAASDKLGAFMGTRIGKAIGVAIVLAAAKAGQDAVFENIITPQVSGNVAKLVAAGDVEALKQYRATLAASAKLGGPLMEFFDPLGTKKQIDAQVAEIDAGLARLEAAAATGGEAIGDSFDRAVVSGVQAGAPEVTQAVAQVVGPGPSSIAEASARLSGRQIGTTIPESIADGVQARRAVVGDAFDRLKDLMKTLLGRGQVIARDIGILTSQKLAEGLKDRRHAVRVEAQKVQAETEQELATLILKGGKVGKKAMDELKQGLNSKNPDVRAAAERVQAIVDGKLQGTVPIARQAGKDAGAAYAQALLSAVGAATRTALVGGPSGFSAAAKRAGKNPDRRAGGGPVEKDKPYIVGEDGWELFIPPHDGEILSHSESVKPTSSREFWPESKGSSTTVVNMPITGVLKARSWSDISGEMQRIDDSGVLPDQRISPKYNRHEYDEPGSKR